MRDQEILERLTPIFKDALMRDDVNLQPQYSAKDVDGWDSLSHIDIILAVEQDFGVKFTTRELDSMQSVGDLIQTIAAKSGG